MKVEVRVETSCEEPKIIIETDRVTDEINELVQKLSGCTPQMIVGLLRDGQAKILDQSDIVRVFTSGGKVYAETEEGEYSMRRRLYELEERLDKGRFVRISNSEIVNLQKVKEFDLSLVGTICVSLTNGAVTYVSRRYVAKIKRVLGI
jgi:DNA-binding LytR/AlgR family response regulator